MFTPKQQTIIWGGLAILGLLATYVPWTYTLDANGNHREKPAGYHFIVTPPAPERESPFFGVKIDWTRVIVPMVVVLIATAAAVVLVGKRSPQQISRPPEPPALGPTPPALNETAYVALMCLGEAMAAHGTATPAAFTEGKKLFKERFLGGGGVPPELADAIVRLSQTREGERAILDGFVMATTGGAKPEPEGDAGSRW